MTLRLADAWVWDFWLADDGERYHLFFLRAPRTGGDPHQRHFVASVGHAVSTDLHVWSPVADALTAGPAPAFDDVATWTGSVLQAPDGQWCMFYTGLSGIRGAYVQQVGLATSDDLLTWWKHPASPLLVAEPRWYERLGESPTFPDETWRDPWVFRDPGNDGWHMLLTARAKDGPDDDRGVIGHARSADLLRWEAQPPLSAAGGGFGQLEVPQVEEVDGGAVLVFSCLSKELSAARRVSAGTGGVWAAPAASLLGPYAIADAVALTDDAFYSGRLVRDRSGRWVMLAFHNMTSTREFVGEISDPMPVGWSDDGSLTLTSLTLT